MVAALGGASNILSSYNTELQIDAFKKDIYIQQSGYVQKIKTRDLGLILIELGGGRKQVTDKINFNVGYDNVLSVGDRVDSSTPLLTVYCHSDKDFENVGKKIEECFLISDKEVSNLSDIYEVIS